MGRWRTKGRKEGDGKDGGENEVKQREVDIEIESKAGMERKMETDRMDIEKMNIKRKMKKMDGK